MDWKEIRTNKMHRPYHAATSFEEVCRGQGDGFGNSREDYMFHEKNGLIKRCNLTRFIP